MGGAFSAFYSLDRTAEEWTGNRRERGNDLQQRATGGIEPVVAVARTQPLYVRHLLYHLSHRAPLLSHSFEIQKINFVNSHYLEEVNSYFTRVTHYFEIPFCNAHFVIVMLILLRKFLIIMMGSFFITLAEKVTGNKRSSIFRFNCKRVCHPCMAKLFIHLQLLLYKICDPSGLNQPASIFILFL